MVILLDSTSLEPGETEDILADLHAQAGLPMQVTQTGPDPATVLEHWSFATHDLFIARSNGLRMTRHPADVKAAAPEAIRLGYQISGRYRLIAEGHHGGPVTITDLTRPCDFSLFGTGAAAASFQISYTDLNMSVEAVRRVLPGLSQSSVYPLMQNHLARVSVLVGQFAAPELAVHIGSATVELARALIVGADSGPHSREALNEALRTRIFEFIQLHLTDEDLTPESIAAAHTISLRHLYRLWADEGAGVAEYIVAERLARAAEALREQSDRSVTEIAFSLGFSSAAHFSRRFRAEYGASPKDWRRLQLP